MEMMGSVPVVSLFNRQDIEKVLKFPSKYPFRPPTEIVSFYRSSRPDRYSSVGMANAQGPEWAHLRMNLTPQTFENRLILSKFCPELNLICDDFIKQIKEKRNDENVAENVEDVLKSMSFESACCLILGRRMGFMEEVANSTENVQELADAVKNIFKSFRDAYYGNFYLTYLNYQIAKF
jgi:ecdysone 20-monooxygenase